MADPADDGEAIDEDLPDAVREWISSLAADRGVSETELLQSVLGEGDAPTADRGGVDQAELDRVEREFRELVEDVRDRVIQVKREADEKAPADHSHHDLRTSLEQLGREVAALESEVEQLDDRLAGGFENYEEILTYLTETTDTLDRKLGRLAAAVIDLRDVVGDAARDEVRRTALSHLTETANRHGVEKAKCEECGEGVHVGMLVEPQCPHCDSSFSALEPKRGFFRSSVLHTGTMPALEAGASPDAEPDSLEAMVEDAAAGGDAPRFEMDDLVGPESGAADVQRAPERESADEPPADDGGDEPAGDAAEPTASAPDGPDRGTASADGGPERDVQPDLERIDGIGAAYADRLTEAGIDDLLALAVADPEQLGEAIDVPAATVADWVEQADAMTGS